MEQQTDLLLSFDELIAASHSERNWVLALIEEEVISVSGTPQQAEFSGFHLARVRRAQRLSHDFEASVPALGLIMRLLDEVEELRKNQRPLSLLDEQ